METLYGSKVFFIPSLVRLGVKSLSCRRYGICELKLIDEFEHELKPFKGRSYAILQVKADGLVGIHFLDSSMDRETRRKYFCNNVFTVEECYMFNVWIEGYKVECKVPKCDYSVLRQSGYLSINIDFVTDEFLYPHSLGHLKVDEYLGSLSMYDTINMGS